VTLSLTVRVVQKSAVSKNVGNDDFVVSWADADANAAADVIAHARTAPAATSAAGAVPDILQFEPYKRPVHDSVVNGVSVPQTPLNDDMHAHLKYESDVLALLRKM
jgi:hypothetical protein